MHLASYQLSLYGAFRTVLVPYGNHRGLKMAYASNDPGFDAFMRRISSFPFLDPEEEARLARSLWEHQDRNARERLVNAHLRLVGKFARNFAYRYRLPAADLFGEGVTGLMEATSRFDPDRDVRFATYATWWIRSSVQNYILRNWSIVRGGTSSSQKALFFQFYTLRQKIARFDRTLSEAEIDEHMAAALGISRADVTVMRQRRSGDVSLNQPLTDEDGDESERIDFLIDASLSQEELLTEANGLELGRKALQEALARLPPREEYILRARHLRDTDEPATLEDLSEIFGISRERVRQVGVKARNKVDAYVRERLVPSHASET